jgi:hypothetical protein
LPLPLFGRQRLKHAALKHLKVMVRDNGDPALFPYGGRIIVDLEQGAI